MSIIDSITKQVIKDGEDLMLMFLVNARSEVSSVPLLTRHNEQYKIASLPIKAFWDDGQLQVKSDDQLAIQTFADSIGMQGSSFSEIVSSLWVNGAMGVEQPSASCSDMREFSIFAVKTSTLDKLASTAIVQANVPMKAAESHLAAALGFIPTYVEVSQKIDMPNLSKAEKEDLYLKLDHCERVVKLTNDHGYDEDYQEKIPYASYALNTNTPFSWDLRTTLIEHDFFDDTGSFDLHQYTEFYLRTHEAVALKHAMSFLDIPFAPTYYAQSRFRDASKLEFMSKVLIEELNEHCREAKDYDDNPAQGVEKLVSPLKTCVADLLKLQQKLESGRKP